MNTPADLDDDAVRRTLRSIGDAAGPAPSFERLSLPPEPDVTALPADRRARPALIAGLAAASLLVVGVAGWAVLDDEEHRTVATEPPAAADPTTPSPTAGDPTAPSTAPTVPPVVDAATPAWTRLAASPLSPRMGATTVWTGTEVIVFGGAGENLLCPPGADCVPPEDPDVFADGAAYDPATDTWRPIADAPLPVWQAQAVAVDGNVYVMAPCGEAAAYWKSCPRSCPPGGCTDHVFARYDPAADEWELLAPSPAGMATLVAAGEAVAAVHDSDEGGERRDHLFDVATSTWSRLPDDPLPPSYDRQVVASDGGLHLFAKPIPEPGDNDQSPVIGARYDLARHRWTALPASGTSGFDAWLVDGRVVVNPHFSRDSGGGVYDIDGRSWSDLPAGPPDDSWRGDMVGAVGEDTAGYGRTDAGWVLDVPSGQWLRIAPRDEHRPVADAGFTAAGRRLFVFGGDRWPADGGEGELVAEAWMWTPPGVFDGLDLRLELARRTVAPDDTIRSTLTIENRSGATVTDPGCWLSAVRWGLVPVDDPGVELEFESVVDCGGPLDLPGGFGETWGGPDFYARTITGDPLPPGEYLASIEIDGRTERLTAPVTIE